MDPYEKAERQRQARHRLHAQKARAGRLRNRVIVSALVCFALLWGVVFVQMATGNDPVLGSSSRTKTVRVKKAPAAKAEVEAEFAQAEAEAAEAEPIELQAAEAQELESVTTSQS